MRKQLKIAILDMDQRISRSLNLVLHGLADEAVEIYVVDDAAGADIFLVDLDRESSVSMLRNLLELGLPGTPIGISSASARLDGFPVLLKPLSPEALLSAICSRSALRSARDKRPVSMAEQRVPIFDPSEYLLGCVLTALQRAKARDAAAVLRFYGDRIIAIDPDAFSPRAFTNITPAQMQGFAISVLDQSARPDPNSPFLAKPSLRLIGKAEIAKLQDCQALPLESFLWRLGSLTSRGRLPSVFAPPERAYISRWPKLSKSEEHPIDAKIVAYWLPQAASPLEIAQALGIPLSEVARVFTAAYAAGLANQSRRASDGLWEAQPAEILETKTPNLVSSALLRLKNGKPI